MCSWQDLSQYGTEEPSGPPKGGLEGWPATGLWYSVAGLLAAWASRKDWPDVSGPWDMVEKAM